METVGDFIKLSRNIVYLKVYFMYQFKAKNHIFSRETFLYKYFLHCTHNQSQFKNKLVVYSTDG
ncbi:hypothetical protein C0J52_08385 [Blattella germanica]|nr:hypothetical protein C0J52_08385 [Blattella germanica]